MPTRSNYRNYSKYWGTLNIGAGPDFPDFSASENSLNIGALSEIAALNIGALAEIAILGIGAEHFSSCFMQSPT